MRIVFAVLAIILAYLLGSLPIGVVTVRLISGVEIRKIGSGRTGATNVYRAVGIGGLILTCLGDVLKGVFAIQLARLLTMFALSAGAEPSWLPWIESLAGIVAIAGHNWSVFLNFRGGAGTVASIGVLAALNGYVAIPVVVFGVIALVLSHTASVGSITVALAMGPALVISAAMSHTPWAYVLFGIVAGALTIYALLPNIRRILSGQERQLKTNQ